MGDGDLRKTRERFVELLHEHQRVVSKIASLYAADRSDREDLFQEILVQLWRAWPAFRGEASFATWAYRVALNTALFRRRKARAEASALGAAGPDPAGVPAPSDADPLESGEAARLLHECIRALPELDRAIVLLHLEERAHTEIAAITGLSRGNVDVRLHRIRKELRRALLARGIAAEVRA